VIYADTNTESGDALNRSFCSLCGSNLVLQNSYLLDRGLIAITTGTINEKSELQRPDLELFCRNRRTWLSEVERTEKDI
jgi:hypothetical protein